MRVMTCFLNLQLKPYLHQRNSYRWIQDLQINKYINNQWYARRFVFQLLLEEWCKMFSNRKSTRIRFKVCLKAPQRIPGHESSVAALYNKLWNFQHQESGKDQCWNICFNCIYLIPPGRGPMAGSVTYWSLHLKL